MTTNNSNNSNNSNKDNVQPIKKNINTDIKGSKKLQLALLKHSIEAFAFTMAMNDVQKGKVSQEAMRVMMEFAHPDKILGICSGTTIAVSSMISSGVLSLEDSMEELLATFNDKLQEGQEKMTKSMLLNTFEKGMGATKDIKI